MTTTGSGNGNGTRPPVEPPKTIAVPAPARGEVVRQGFGTSEMERSAETASSAMASQARAAVEARYVMALKRPRDLLVARSALLKDCARASFAEAAIYRKPVGDGIEGPSIRLAEAAARAMTNIDVSTLAIYDDRDKRIVRVSATDLETNITFTKDVTVPKTMERSSLKPGQPALGSRMNSKGRPVFLVKAETDDDILNTENALASKAIRVCLLRLIPGDLLEEAMIEATKTLRTKDKEDPDAAIKTLCDRFELELGITPAQLSQYLGRPISEITVAEVAGMRKLFTALVQGEATWAEAMDNRSVATGGAAGASAPTSQAQATSNSAPAASPATGTAAPKQQSLDEVAAASRKKREQEAAAKAQATAGPRPVSASVSSDDDERSATDPLRTDPNWQPPSDDDVPPWGGGRGK